MNTKIAVLVALTIGIGIAGFAVGAVAYIDHRTNSLASKATQPERLIYTAPASPAMSAEEQALVDVIVSLTKAAAMVSAK